MNLLDFVGVLALVMCVIVPFCAVIIFDYVDTKNYKELKDESKEL